MKGLYYHPSRIKHNGAPVLIDAGKHGAITLFVRLIEQMVPEVMEELKNEVLEAYARADHWYAMQSNLSPQEGPSEWNIVKESSYVNFPAYNNLKEKLIKWSNKYHLNGIEDFYLTLALWSIGNYYEECNEVSRKQRVKEIQEYARIFGVSVEECRSMAIYKNSWPYEECISLSESLYFEDEPDDIELSKSIGKGEQIFNSFFSRVFPFTFTPEILSDIGKRSPNILTYESLRLFDETRSDLLGKANTRDYSEFEVLTKPWEGGIGWDPRIETWKEFEEKMDKQYEQYKTLYRERSSQFLRERGYVKDKEKRKMEHFKWLVDYQIKGWSIREIADYYSGLNNEIINEDTVFHGVRNTASLVLIHLRSSKNS
ncbi:hypothetical protein M4D81_28405 [Paenibacillus sp. p3-SID867]|uniref:hypothetical protein n=1 Tax=Paenibacillus sp. p3-SID867 TaxID=2916363 RepID=UPI0021A48483|nr:hypothetical protein [Paenibacillus sp. p3-SID867]MCT1402923.1 hypothetical protein [Paenibacillus sp. p3-SID867]